MPQYTPKSGIYIIANTQNGMIYIGQAKDIRDRWRDHKNDLAKSKHKNRHLQNAYNKYGSDCFKYQILEYCPVEKLDEREQHFLDVYMPKRICYNIALHPRTTTGTKLTDEHKRKISEALYRRPPASEETRERLSEALIGHVLSVETKSKISASRKGTKVSEETKQKLSLQRKGVPHSEDHKRKLSEAAKLRWQRQKAKQ